MLSHARHGVILTRTKSLISKRGNPYNIVAVARQRSAAN